MSAIRLAPRVGSAVNAPNTPYRPLLTNAARPSTFTVRATDETGAMRDTPIAGEHPLTLYVDKHELVTLMTLGAAPEALAIGYLRNQRLIERVEDIVADQVDWDVGAVVVKTRHGLADFAERTQKRTTTSGCGVTLGSPSRSKPFSLPRRISRNNASGRCSATSRFASCCQLLGGDQVFRSEPLMGRF